ncbi:hypothetical protein Lal_00039769 [Lupinus albus]|nr:hypothetical protein Lal_00039769 [Lupinus albus]
MAGRGRSASQNVTNDFFVQMVATLHHVNENLQSLNQNAAPSPSSQPLVPQGPAEYRGLDEFCRRNPSQFQGGFASDAAIEWVQGLERIFSAMSYSDAQKVGMYEDDVRVRDTATGKVNSSRKYGPQRNLMHH